MALLYTKTRQNASGGYETDLINSAGKDWDAAFWLSNGIFSTGRKPCFVNFQGDTYVAGAFSRVLVRHKVDRRMLPAGIVPVRQKIAIANGAGSGGSTASGVLGYVTLLHKEGARVLAESDRSNVVDVGASSGTGWAWSNLPTTNEDFRVTHIRGYRSVDGSDYRMAWESPFGITSFTENALTRNTTILGQDAGRNAVPPKGVQYMVDWGGRMFYARTAEHPYRMWWSAPGNPQYVDPSNFVDTWDRLAITGLAKQGTNLIAFQQREGHLVRQFGEESRNDFVFIKIENSVGCINHFGLVEIHRRLWVPAEDGVWIFDGGFRYLMRDFRRYWVADYKANPAAFQAGHAYDDRKAKTYVFVTGRDPAQDLGEKTGLTCGTIGYVGSYENFEPSMGGQSPEPDWTLDVAGRRNSAALYDAAGDVLIGSCDGIIRKFDDSDADDDDDTLDKELIIRHGHQVYGRPGDDEESGGKTLTSFWCYVEAELNAWTLYLLAGDESAWNQIRPDNVLSFYKKDIPASLQTFAKTIAMVVRNFRALPKTVHVIEPQRVSGRGWTVEIRASNPVGMKYRGHGGSFAPGKAFRPAEVELL